MKHFFKQNLLKILGGLFVSIFSFCYFYKLQFVSKFYTETDGFFHIKFAYLTRLNGIMHDFKWAQFSIWKDHFYDKEFLFHYLLQIFTFGDLEFGAKLAAVTFATIIVLTFYIILCSEKIKLPVLWTMLLFISSSFFLYRINVCRPQILSITLSLICVVLIFKQKPIALLILSIIYNLSYTAGFIVIIYALIFVVSKFILTFAQNKTLQQPQKVDYWIILAATIGTIVGLLIHPNFPNNIYGFYVQNIHVLITAWGSSAHELHLGGEFYPMDTRVLFKLNTLPILTMLTIMFLGLFNYLKLSFKSFFIFILSICFFILTLLTKRFTEYWIPYSLLAFTMIINDSFDLTLNKFLTKKYLSKLITLSLIILISYIASFKYIYNNLYSEFNAKESRYKNAALWIKDNIAKDEIIYTCDWDDAPDLFFYNENNRYMVFLDPHFMYDWESFMWYYWDNLSNGNIDDIRTAFLYDFKTKYGYCTNNFGSLISKITAHPEYAKILYSDAHGVVFEIY